MGRAGDVQRYIERLTAEVRGVFGGEVVGTWLIGSLAYGGFGPASDVDVQMAVGAARPDAIADLVDRIRHPRLRCPAAGLEFVLYEAAVLERPSPPMRWSLNLNGGPERPHKVDTDPSAEPWHWFLLDLAVARKTATTLDGLDLADVLGPISEDAVIDAIAASVDWHAAHDRGTYNQRANYARSLRYLLTGRWSSKPEALRWATESGYSGEQVEIELRDRIGRRARR